MISDKNDWTGYGVFPLRNSEYLLVIGMLQMISDLNGKNDWTGYGIFIFPLRNSFC